MRKLAFKAIATAIYSFCSAVGAQSIAAENSENLITKSTATKISYLNGTWDGTYKCAQGLTKLTLVIQAKSTTEIGAVFVFSAHPQNPTTASGRFKMEGSLELSSINGIPDLLKLQGVEWINRPSNYEMVNLTGDVASSKRKITGNVAYSGCSTFELLKRES